MTWARPLRRQLFVAILLLLAPILAAGVWLGVVEYRETVEELSELSDTTARRTAAAVERELTGIDRMARNLSSHPAVRDLDAAAAELLEPQRLQVPPRDQKTVTVTSFDVPLVPQVLRARTRTKYVPGVATAVNEVETLPVAKFAMLVAPENEPASTT